MDPNFIKPSEKIKGDIVLWLVDMKEITQEDRAKHMPGLSFLSKDYLQQKGICVLRPHEPEGIGTVVKASLHPVAKARNSDLIKDKLYSTKINPEEKGIAFSKLCIHPRSGKNNFY